MTEQAEQLTDHLICPDCTGYGTVTVPCEQCNGNGTLPPARNRTRLRWTILAITTAVALVTLAGVLYHDASQNARLRACLAHHSVSYCEAPPPVIG